MRDDVGSKKQKNGGANDAIRTIRTQRTAENAPPPHHTARTHNHDTPVEGSDDTNATLSREPTHTQHRAHAHLQLPSKPRGHGWLDSSAHGNPIVTMIDSWMGCGKWTMLVAHYSKTNFVFLSYLRADNFIPRSLWLPTPARFLLL